jgi:hypothetical protein
MLMFGYLFHIFNTGSECDTPVKSLQYLSINIHRDSKPKMNILRNLHFKPALKN